MNKHYFIAALATLATGSVLAQSSVTLYGRLNETVERVKIGNDKVTELRDNTSFLGFKGVEDLGGGLKASFLLEAQFDAGTGAAGTAGNQGGTFFGRESWVALGSDNLGRVRLGNVSSSAFYYATADYVGQHNHDVGTSADAFFLYVGNVKNTVAYITPVLFGTTTVEVQYGLGEKAENIGYGRTKETKTIAVMYENGPWHAGGGYITGPGGRLFGGGPDFADNLDPAATGSNPLNDSESYGARLLYDITPVWNIGGYVNRDELDDGTESAKRTSYRVVSRYTIGASDFFLDVGRANKWSGTSKTAATQYTVDWNYNLSKRTKFYAYYTRIDNDSNIYYGPGFNNGNSGSAGDNFSSIAVGIRHLF